jgi:hypothetical protein
MALDLINAARPSPSFQTSRPVLNIRSILTHSILSHYHSICDNYPIARYLPSARCDADQQLGIRSMAAGSLLVRVPVQTTSRYSGRAFEPGPGTEERVSCEELHKTRDQEGMASRQSLAAVKRPHADTHPSYRRTLTRSEKSAYIKAVKCLQAKPARLRKEFTGVRSRYDDFVGCHVSQTGWIHFNVSYSHSLCCESAADIL